MSALTYELLRRRVSRLFERTMAEHGPVEDIVFERVVCDRCGRSVNLITEPWPVGWTTAGGADGGWVDLCGACSQ